MLWNVLWQQIMIIEICQCVWFDKIWLLCGSSFLTQLWCAMVLDFRIHCTRVWGCPPLNTFPYLLLVSSLCVVHCWILCSFLWCLVAESTELTNLTNPAVHLSHIPQCTTLEQKCAHFCSKVVHRGIWDRCIVGFVRYVFLLPMFILPRLGYAEKLVTAWRDWFFLVLNLDWWNQTWPVVCNSRDLIQTNYISNARTMEIQ